MIRTVSLSALALAVVAGAVSPETAAAQDPAPSRFSGAVAFLNTQPVGGLRTGPGFGVALTGAYALDQARIFRIRGDLRFASYGHERREVCLSQTVGCWIRVDLNTNYGTAFAGIGPEVAIPVGPVHLVLDGTVGVGHFTVGTSLSGVDDYGENAFDTTHFEDTVFAWSTGGELRVPVSRKVAIALGSHYVHNGQASYVLEGGVTENPDGTLRVSPISTDANMVAITLGVAFRP
jgi:hypothetical protein